MVIFPTPIVSWLSPVSYHIAISHARKIFTTASEAHLKSPAGTGRCNEAVFTAEQHTNRQANYIGDKQEIKSKSSAQFLQASLRMGTRSK